MHSRCSRLQGKPIEKPPVLVAGSCLPKPRPQPQPSRPTMKSVTSMSLCGFLCGLAVTSSAASATLLGWNNLGMHCMDSDYSVFSILPPYNTIEAQLIVNGRLVTNGSGYTVSYQALPD